MYWKFKVKIKCIYDNGYIRWKFYQYNATDLTWFDAWQRCIYETMFNEVKQNEVVVSVESLNDIAR